MPSCKASRDDMPRGINIRRRAMHACMLHTTVAASIVRHAMPNVRHAMAHVAHRADCCCGTDWAALYPTPDGCCAKYMHALPALFADGNQRPPGLLLPCYPTAIITIALHMA